MIAMPTQGRELSGTGLRFDDVEPGDWFDTPSREVTVGEIDRFAELTGDRFEIHLSDEAARALGFPARVAHGLLVLSIVDGLKNNSKALFAAVASLGWNWRFERPVFVADRLHARITIMGKRETRRLDRGILELDFAVLDQFGNRVQSGTNQLMVLR